MKEEATHLLSASLDWCCVKSVLNTAVSGMGLEEL